MYTESKHIIRKIEAVVTEPQAIIPSHATNTEAFECQIRKLAISPNAEPGTFPLS